VAEDIRLVWNKDLMECDFGLGVGDLLTDGGLTTAVYISLFTDRRARDDDKLDDINDKHGWWGDQTSSAGEIGSRLWLLNRAKTTTQNLNLARIYIQEALQWMLDDKVAQKIDIQVERAGDAKDRLYYQVSIYKSDGDKIVMGFDDLWNVQADRDW
jgi:phage gp46-like protein